MDRHTIHSNNRVSICSTKRAKTRILHSDLPNEYSNVQTHCIFPNQNSLWLHTINTVPLTFHLSFIGFSRFGQCKIRNTSNKRESHQTHDSHHHIVCPFRPLEWLSPFLHWVDFRFLNEQCLQSFFSCSERVARSWDGIQRFRKGIRMKPRVKFGEFCLHRSLAYSGFVSLTLSRLWISFWDHAGNCGRTPRRDVERNLPIKIFYFLARHSPAFIT